MNMRMNYPDTVTFVKVTSGKYANSKVVEEQEDVSVMFLQDTNFQHAGSQDALTADAICYPDPTNDFILDNWNRLEGMYILAPLFDVADANGWYKVASVTVNRDHLLGNTTDNVELLLKKSTPIPGVS